MRVILFIITLHKHQGERYFISTKNQGKLYLHVDNFSTQKGIALGHVKAHAQPL